MALTFDLAAIPLKYVAFPIVAGLAAGTGALAAYVTTPSMPAPKEPIAIVAALPVNTMPPAPVLASEQITPVKPAKKLSCEEQTWPYIDNRCIARKGDKGGEPTRTVRVVVAARDEGGSASSTQKLITSDGVLRGPGVAPEADAPQAKPATPTVKKAAKRVERRQSRDDYGRVYSVYSVPSSSEGTKPVIVVRPARIEQYSLR